MRGTRTVLITVCAVFAFTCATAGFAQTTAGAVKGTVNDQTQAVVPGAALTLLNTETRISRRSQSNEAGLFSFPNLPAGKYELLAEKEGFKSWRGRLELQVQQVAVVDPVLAVGAVATTIEVADVTPVIASEGASISTVTEFRRIQQLPLNGRDVTQLFKLTPGVQSSSAPRINGLKAGSAEILQDGASIVDRMSNGMPRISPGLDTVQEFNIDMNSSAQFSRPATITMLTRGGTNSLHGSLFETHRNNGAGLRARRREEGNQSSQLIRNEFGASAGGPILMPKLYNGRDKSFWFFSYQGNRRRQGSIHNEIVPTQSIWDGNFSNIVDAQGHRYTIYDPSTTDARGVRQPIPGNTIPASVPRNKLYQVLMEKTPRPTNTSAFWGDSNWTGTVPEPYNMNTYTWKLDHRISAADSVSGRFTISDSDQYGYFGGPPASDLAFNFYRNKVKMYSGAITHTHIFSPTTLNELVLSGQRSGSLRGGGREDVKWDALLGLSNPFNEYGWPTITGGNGLIWDSENKSPEYLNTLILEDNLTLVRGKHEIKFGFRARNERNNTRGAQQGQGRYKFTDGWTALWDPINQLPVPYTGVGMASMLLGHGSFYAAKYNRPFYYLRQTELGMYVQDAWKATPRLTLTYGLRYDHWTPYYESSHRMYNMDLSRWQTTRQLITPANHSAESLGTPPSLLQSFANAGLTWTTADKVGFPTNLQNSEKFNFAPRLAAAYKLTDKTVLRGSYGMYHWTVPQSQMLLSKLYSVPLFLPYMAELDYWDFRDYYDVRSQPVPGERVGDPNMVDINSPRSVSPPFGFVPYAKDWRNARAQEWNLTIEREIMPMTNLRLSYIGNHGDHLEQLVNLNSQESQYLYTTRTGQAVPSDGNQRRVNPFWDTLPVRDSIGYSNSHSLQVNFQRRHFKGLDYQVYWVFSRNLSTSDSDGYASGPGAGVPDPVLLPNAGSLADRLKLVYYNVASIAKHQVNWNAIYDLPFGHGKTFGRNMSRGLDRVLGNWQLETLGAFRSGNWLTPDTNYFLNGDPRLSSGRRQEFYFSGRPRMLYFQGNFNAAGIAGLENYQAGLIQVGTNNRVPVQLKDGSVRTVPYDIYNPMSRNFIEGPKSWGTDFTVAKNFPVGESKNIRFTADFFNVLNHPNNVSPNTTTGLIDLSRQDNDPRIIQFSLRLDF